jgi:metal-responsive CopG/Arc/MetJ family transcriptional regulator
MEKKDVRIQLVISQSEIDALDEWRAKHKLWSRSEAIRVLIEHGIKKDPPQKN